MKYLYPLLGLLLLGYCLWLDETLRDSQKMAIASASLNQTPEAEAFPSLPAEVGARWSLDQRVLAMQARRPGQIFDPTQVQSALGRPHAWQLLARADENASVIESGAKVELPLTLDRLKIESLMPGDMFSIPGARGGEAYRASIERVDSLGDQRVRWLGRILEPDDKHYPLSLIQDSVSTRGQLETPTGRFTIHATGERGWMASEP